MEQTVKEPYNFDFTTFAEVGSKSPSRLLAIRFT
jgi:hypothetical protein